MNKKKSNVDISKKETTTSVTPEPVLPKAAAPDDVTDDAELKALCPEDGNFEDLKAWFNRTSKVTLYKGVLELREQFNKLTDTCQSLLDDKQQANIEREKHRADMTVKDNDIVDLWNQISTLKNREQELLAEIERLKMNVTELDNTASVMDKSINVLQDLVQADVVEVVAIPPNPEVKIRPLTYQGHKVRMEKDDGGYYHFWVPRPFAATLLAASFGVKYILIGPDEKMAVKRYGSSRTEEITVYKHVKTQYATGGVKWVPLVNEDESGNGDA